MSKLVVAALMGALTFTLTACGAPSGTSPTSAPTGTLAATPVVTPTAPVPAAVPHTVPAPAAVVAALTALVAGELPRGVSVSGFVVSAVRLSAADPAWASARVIPKKGQTDPAVLVAHRGPAGWVLVGLGTAQVGCFDATPAVRADLALSCP